MTTSGSNTIGPLMHRLRSLEGCLCTSPKGLFPSTQLKAMGFITTQHKMPGSKGTHHPNPANTCTRDEGRGILG